MDYTLKIIQGSMGFDWYWEVHYRGRCISDGGSYMFRGKAVRMGRKALANARLGITETSLNSPSQGLDFATPQC